MKKQTPYLSNPIHIENNPKVSVVIVNYNGGQDIFDCLESLQNDQAATSIEIIIVDNNSTDGSTAKISAHFESVKLLPLGENRGFAAACNAGIAIAHADTVLLLNPDTVVMDGAISKMYDELLKHPQWGIVGARMLTTARISYRAARRFPTPRNLAMTSIGLAKIFSTSKYFNGYLYGERAIESLDEVDQVEGSCLMISEAARKTVGNLDEQFFIFFEEVDWCKRVKAAGYEIHIVNEAEVVHKVSTTMGKYFEFTRTIHAQSAMKYFRKHEGESSYNAIRNAMSKALLVRALILAIPALFNIGGSRKRFAGTLAERRTYKEGLTG
ncbi:MAG: glycosyltransferase family 2 protein [bacterium]|nr:glycosyltransferase family 2 protein [bacterium]